MSGDLVPRSKYGSAPRLIEGPKIGQRSLYQQQVLDEDTYTDALSHIITRDFFPHLPHMHATNDYLTALTNNDPELLSASIRRLAALAHEKEQQGQAGPSRRTRASDSEKDQETERARRAELENVGTPYISLPGRAGRAPLRTPVGARGWDTPDARDTHSARAAQVTDESDDEADLDALEGGLGLEAGASRPRKKRRKQDKDRLLRVRDDLSLDAFQRNYTSEDNASFVQIVDDENKKRKEERWAWAWEAEKRANTRRIEGEDRRRLLLEGTKDGITVDGTGRRLIGGLAEPGRDRAEGEAWREQKLLTASTHEEGTPDQGAGIPDDSAGALVKYASSTSDGALITSRDASASLSQGPTPKLAEVAVPSNHPLAHALTSAGLPATALVSTEDGALVPARETTSGAGDGRGRGDEDRDERKAVERDVMGEEEQEYLALSGSGGDMWGYKTRNNFFFPADANTDPYPKNRPAASQQDEKANRAAHQAPKEINYANTRLPDDDEVGPASTSKTGSTRRGSSPARSWVDAAVTGTPYRPQDSMPSVNNYPLLPTEPTPSPQDLPSLLTWGTLLATPRALDGSSDPLDTDPTGRKFRLPEASRRDTLGRKLADKASRAMNERARSYTPRSSGVPGSGSALSAALRSAADKTVRSTPRGKGGEMGPPGAGGMTPRANGLTPAGRMLLERSLGKTPGQAGKGGFGVGGGRRGEVMEKAGGWGGVSGGAAGGKAARDMGWTPSPARKK